MSPARSHTITGCGSEPSVTESIDGVNILIPEDVLGVLSSPRPSNVSNECCWKSMQVLLDKDERPILISLDDFLCGVDFLVLDAHLMAPCVSCSRSWLEEGLCFGGEFVHP
eukprot:6484862-Amphidinium_carterae.1